MTPLDPIYLTDLASRQASWLSVRQATVAGNISHADTPGYRARDVEPFKDVLDKTRLAMTGTSPAHMGQIGEQPTERERDTKESWAITPSGNSVTLEEELSRAREVRSAFTLNRGVVGAFHKLLMTSLRGAR